MEKLCETCEAKPANNQVDGVFLCVDCIVATNRAILRDDGKRLNIERPLGIVQKAPVANVRTLVQVMAGVMDKLIAGDIDASTAQAICKVSCESLKGIELIWRMTKE